MTKYEVLWKLQRMTLKFCFLPKFHILSCQFVFYTVRSHCTFGINANLYFGMISSLLLLPLLCKLPKGVTNYDYIIARIFT